jgi:hypothetical protein
MVVLNTEEIPDGLDGFPGTRKAGFYHNLKKIVPWTMIATNMGNGDSLPPGDNRSLLRGDNQQYPRS